MTHDRDDDNAPVTSASPMSTAATLSTEEESIVAAFDTVLEAEMARGRLEVDGIVSRIVDGNTVGIAAHLSMALGGAKVVVAHRDLEAARAILFSPSAFAVDDAELEARALEAAPAKEVRPPVRDDADSHAARALKAAVFGLVFAPPVGHLYSLLVLTNVLRRRTELTPKGRRQASIALAIDGAVIAASAIALAAIL